MEEIGTCLLYSVSLITGNFKVWAWLLFGTSFMEWKCLPFYLLSCIRYFSCGFSDITIKSSSPLISFVHLSHISLQSSSWCLHLIVRPKSILKSIHPGPIHLWAATESSRNNLTDSEESFLRDKASSSSLVFKN